MDVNEVPFSPISLGTITSGWTKPPSAVAHSPTDQSYSDQIFEQLSLYMNSFILETPRLRNIDEILESDKPIEDNAFKNMVNDPEFDEAINEIFEGLRETDEWNDLIDYYIALEYIFGAVDNVFSMEQNHDFGVDLMLKYAAIGNTFALSYVSSMIIS